MIGLSVKVLWLFLNNKGWDCFFFVVFEEVGVSDLIWFRVCFSWFGDVDRGGRRGGLSLGLVLIGCGGG